MSPKSDAIQMWCGHTPFCPDPLVYLSNLERQPHTLEQYTINLHPLESRRVEFKFNSAGPWGLPPEMELEVIEVSRERFEPRYEPPLSYRVPPLKGSGEVTLYEDHELKVTTPNIRGKMPTVGRFLVIVTAKRELSQGHGTLNFRVRKAGTRWGGWGQVSLTVWTHQK